MGATKQTDRHGDLSGSGTADPTKIWEANPAPPAPDPHSPADATFAGTAPADAPAEPDGDDQSVTGRDAQPATDSPKPSTGADASSHGGR